jgi:signal transduction histidine kinase
MLALALAGCAPGTPPDGPSSEVTEVHAAQLRLGDAEEPPSVRLAGWSWVGLPDRWGLARRREATRGWYRVVLDLPSTPSDLWAVYLPHVSMNAAVYVNGSLVGSGGRFREPLARIAQRPLFFRLPPGLLHAGRNVIHVRVAVSPRAPGGLAPFAIGPSTLLRPGYERRFLLQVTLVQWSWVLLCAAAALLLAVHLRRPRPSTYGWLAGAAGSLSLFTAGEWVVEPPVSSGPWEWATAVGALGFAVCCVIALHRVFGRRPRRIEGLLLGQLSLGALLLAVVPPLAFGPVALVWRLIAFGIGAYFLALIYRARPRTVRNRWILIPAAAATALGVHDFAGLVGLRALPGPELFPLVPVLFIIPLSWLMIVRFVEALSEAEALNRELETRVAAKGLELERNHARLRDLERRSVLAAERERLMRDVHDGIGSQLVAALALAEASGPSQRIGATLRDALDDLRLVIDSLDPVEGDLPAVLGMLRSRLESRLEREGVRLEWEVGELPPLPRLGPPGALHALRIVQEAITNALRHARAHTIRVRTGEEKGPKGVPGVFVEVADDGVGMGPRGAAGGRGLGNMAHRAAELGGRLEVVSGGRGTCVRLWIPR